MLPFANRAAPLLFHRTFSSAISRATPLSRVCVVGAGPSGFYFARYLLRACEDVHIDILERLPSPFGLVRSGVAPDHAEVKSVENDFTDVARDSRVNFLGNVEVGTDISLKELRRHYNAVILCYGAQNDLRLGIPGEDNLRNIHSAREFVNWYNGHPDFADMVPDLSSSQDAVIIGHGNVAIDCARILSKTVEELKTTDITAAALEALSKSTIQRVHVVGRRGHVQASFTMKELRECTKLSSATCVVDPEELEKGRTNASLEEIKTKRIAKRMDKLLTDTSKKYEEAILGKRQVIFRFLSNPVEFIPEGRDASYLPSGVGRPPLYPTPGHLTTKALDVLLREESLSRKGENVLLDRVGAVRIERTRLEGEPGSQRAISERVYEDIPAGLVLKSVGYRSNPMEGCAFDEWNRVAANIGGRVLLENLGIDSREKKTFDYGLYCCGWLKRGPSGIIGTNIPDARETIASVMEDAEQGLLKLIEVDQGLDGVISAIVENGEKEYNELIQWSDWEHIDEEEKVAGSIRGAPREKITSIDTMLNVVRKKKLE
eukprot:g2954.t1